VEPRKVAAPVSPAVLEERDIALNRRQAALDQRERELANQRRILAEEYRLLRTGRARPDGPTAPAALTLPKPLGATAPIAAGTSGQHPRQPEGLWSWLKRVMLGISPQGVMDGRAR
jgi:hypothetical protein